MLKLSCKVLTCMIRYWGKLHLTYYDLNNIDNGRNVRDTIILVTPPIPFPQLCLQRVVDNAQRNPWP